MPNPAIYSPESSKQDIVSNQETAFSISPETPTTAKSKNTQESSEVATLSQNEVVASIVDHREDVPEKLHSVVPNADITTRLADQTETEFIKRILEVENEAQ